MPVEPPCSLQQNVNRRYIGEHQIGIDVQALLQGLRADQYKSVLAGGLLAEARLDSCIEKPPVFARKLPMVRSAWRQQGRFAAETAFRWYRRTPEH